MHPGDRVIFIGSKTLKYVVYPAIGTLGTVHDGGRYGARVRWDTDPQDKFGAIYDKAKPYYYDADALQLFVYYVDVDKPIQTRAGGAARLISVMDGDERPIRARVQTPDGRDCELSYAATGKFYKDLETPLDLINVDNPS